jgi:hypothetical protein
MHDRKDSAAKPVKEQIWKHRNATVAKRKQNFVDGTNRQKI